VEARHAITSTRPSLLYPYHRVACLRPQSPAPPRPYRQNSGAHPALSAAPPAPTLHIPTPLPRAVSACASAISMISRAISTTSPCPDCHPRRCPTGRQSCSLSATIHTVLPHHPRPLTTPSTCHAHATHMPRTHRMAVLAPAIQGEAIFSGAMAAVTASRSSASRHCGISAGTRPCCSGPLRRRASATAESVVQTAEPESAG